MSGKSNFSFSPEFQDLMLACLIKHPARFFAYSDLIRPSYFQGVSATITARAAMDYNVQFGRMPSFDTLIELVATESKKLSGDGQDSSGSLEYVRRIRDKPTDDVDFVVGKAVEFAKERATYLAVLKAIEKVKSGETDGFTPLFEEAAGIGTNLDDMGYVLHADYERVIDLVTATGYGVLTGYPAFDRIWRNGWGPGWLVVPLAPPKRFKTAMCLNLALNMVGPAINEPVFYYACEISQELAVARMLCNVAAEKMDLLYESPDRFKTAVKAGIDERIANYLVVKSFPSGSATIGDIDRHISAVKRELGISPKAVYIDYAETVAFSPDVRHMPEYQQQASIYTQARALGHKHGCCVIMPDRVNKETVEKSVPSMTSFQGAFRKAGIVDAAIGLCIHPDQSVITNEGSIKISSIRNRIKTSDKPLYALSHNFSTGKDEWKQILNWFNNGESDRPYIRIQTDARSPDCYPQRSKGAVVTPDHHVFSPDGSKTEAKNVRVGDKIMARGYVMSDDQLQVLIGSLLGDGHISPDGRFGVKHGSRQKYYVSWKHKVFGNLKTYVKSSVIKARSYGTVDLKERESHLLLVKGSSEIVEMRKVFYPDGVKRVPSVDVLNKLNPLGMAVWFMDDCSIEPENDRINLHTNGFTYDECTELVRWFEDRWDWVGKVSANNVIRFNAESTRKILRDLSNFLTRNDVRESDLPYQETKKFSCPETVLGTTKLVPATVTATSENPLSKRKHLRMKLDIEVADNHNYYLASGTLVSNCATEEEYSQNILRSFVFVNRHGPAYQHFRGSVDPETMSIDVGSPIPYEPEDEQRPARGRGRRRGAEVDERLDEEN